MTIVFQSREQGSSISYRFVLGQGWSSLKEAERIHAKTDKRYSNVICEMEE